MPNSQAAATRVEGAHGRPIDAPSRRPAALAPGARPRALQRLLRSRCTLLHACDTGGRGLLAHRASAREGSTPRHANGGSAPTRDTGGVRKCGRWAAQACRPYGASAAQRAQAWTADGRAIIDHRNGRADSPPAHWLTGSQALAGRATGARIIATYARYGGAKEMLVTEVLGTAVLGTADAHPLSAAAVSSARARPCYIAGEIGTGGAARRERRGPGAGASNGSRPRRACGWSWRRRGLPLRQP